MRFAWLLSLVVLLTACATPAYVISEESRCTRYGGFWMGDASGICHVPGPSGR